jgi:four helix bundle protein
VSDLDLLVSFVARQLLYQPIIAEGNARSSTKEYLNHLLIAVGSLAEVDTFLDLTIRLEFGDPIAIQKLNDTISEERMMLRGLQRSLTNRLNATSSDL